MNLTLLPYGERALLVELEDLAAVLALTVTLGEARERGDPAIGQVVEVVPAARTVLLVVDDSAHLAPLRTRLSALATAAQPEVAELADSGEDVEIPVVYDGEDLAAVADLTGLTAAAVVAAHTGTPWRAAFCGFSPGFSYLTGGDTRLTVPRRAEPRTAVPVGSVGLAGEYSAVYPQASPGGWQLIGRTDVVLFDVHREPPALLPPGTRVRFVDVGAR